MNLENRYHNFTILQLVEVIESPVGDYRDEAILAAVKELKSRHTDDEAIRQAARSVLGNRIQQYLENFDVVNGKLALPNSKLLNEEEVKLLFKTEFTRFKTENDDMIPDSWLYVLGAGFG